ncbi:unnamed protein product [Merluccius merluccius]
MVLIPAVFNTMAALLTLLLALLRLWTLSAQELASEQVRPHLTGCVSNDMETFRCSWSVGTFLNLSQPGDLRLFYINANQEKKKRSAQECPQYGPAGTNECFFNENHTSIWTTYSVQLCSRDRAVRYDEAFFHIEEIVQPDPPVGLNWTLLTVGLSGTHFDIKLSWEAPQTADVRTGWMTLQYEVQHRQGASAPWNTMQSTGKALKEAVISAQSDDRLTVGVYESAMIMNDDPDSVSFCVLAVDEDFECDIALQIHFTLIQSFCFDNGISIVRVSDMQRLAHIVGDKAGRFEDAHCLLITNPTDGSWEDPALEKLHLFCQESRGLNDWLPEITLSER